MKIASTNRTTRNAAALAVAAALTGLPLAASAVCLVTDPVFLAEGPVTALPVDNGDGTGLITSMGIPIQIPAGIPVATPTNSALGVAGLADPTPFPGRVEDGFIGATIIATGCVKFDAAGAAFAEADNVFSDVSENVLLGVVTANDGTDIEVLGTPVEILADPRMPGPVDSGGNPTWTRLGIPVQTGSIPLGANAALEGYYADDGVYHVWSVDVDAGTPVDNVAQTGIAEFRCGPAGTVGSMRVFGGSFTPVDPNNCGETVTVVDARNEEIVFGSGVTVPTAPPSAFCEYQLRFDGVICPADITVLNSNGSAATTLAGGVPEPVEPPVAIADSFATDEDVALVVAAPGVLDNDLPGTAIGDLTAQLSGGVQPQLGTLVFNADGSFTYTPDPDVSGTDQFSYIATVDGVTSTIAAVVTITINPVNDAPVATDDISTVPAGLPVTIDVLANDNDVEDDVLTITALGDVSPAGAGTVATDGLTVTFTADANFTGTASFSYTISDGDLTATAVVTVEVTEGQVADLIAITRAQYRAGALEWRVIGTTTAPGAVLTVTLDRTGQVIGQAAADAAGNFALIARNSPVIGQAGDSITVTSSAGGSTTTAIVFRL